MNARVKQQGGWAGSFVIVGIVLALLLLGGVYFLKSKEVNEQLATGTDSSLQTEDKSDQKNTDEQSDQQPAKDDNTKSETKDAESTDKKATDSTSADQSSNAAESSDAAQLPQTGPADTAASLAVFTALSYSVVAYIRSRGRLTL